MARWSLRCCKANGSVRCTVIQVLNFIGCRVSGACIAANPCTQCGPAQEKEAKEAQPARAMHPMPLGMSLLQEGPSCKGHVWDNAVAGRTHKGNVGKKCARWSKSIPARRQSVHTCLATDSANVSTPGVVTSMSRRYIL